MRSREDQIILQWMFLHHVWFILMVPAVGETAYVCKRNCRLHKQICLSLCTEYWPREASMLVGRTNVFSRSLLLELHICIWSVNHWDALTCWSYVWESYKLVLVAMQDPKWMIFAFGATYLYMICESLRCISSYLFLFAQCLQVTDQSLASLQMRTW